MQFLLFVSFIQFKFSSQIFHKHNYHIVQFYVEKYKIYFKNMYYIFNTLKYYFKYRYLKLYTKYLSKITCFLLHKD